MTSQPGDSIFFAVDPRDEDTLAVSLERTAALSPSAALVLLYAPAADDDDAAIGPGDTASFFPHVPREPSVAD
jgi:hypothetical protein